ncbi:helix-turn-helix domain-containing protein [Actinoplanes sp. CA-030573]|uniref:helix-turn-helix domain-containing protein n=1 Tax=Actinoplanes sp. CA-030573 TaxID=3239898 RepID=UPI003D8B718B
MADAQQVRTAWRELGRQLATRRQEAELNQKRFAVETRYSRSSIANIEVGLQHVDRSFWEKADEVLGAGGELVRGYDRAEALQRHHQRPVRRSVPDGAATHLRGNDDGVAPKDFESSLVLASDNAGVCRTGSAFATADQAFEADDSITVDVVIQGENRSVRISRRAVLQAAQAGAAAMVLGDSARQGDLPDVVRAAVLAADVTADDDGVGLDQVEQQVARMHLAYQRAEYDDAAAFVPALMTQVFGLTSNTRHDDRRRVETAAASAHLAVSKLALKFGDAQLAWVAADRARTHSAYADSGAHLQIALVSIGCALLALPGRAQDAASLVERALSTATPQDRRSPARISALGALNLLAAVIASRLDDHTASRAYVRAARELAVELGGDHNALWTGFGPTNVLIHEVSIAAQLWPDRAIALGEKIDTTSLHPSLSSRRSQVHLDLASAFARQANGDASAVLHLLQAEQLTPQLLRVHPPARALIQGLLVRERRAATPGLRALADRVGVEA